MSPNDYNLIEKITGTYQQIESLKFGRDLKIKITSEDNELYFEQSWNDARYKVEYHYLTTFFRPNSISTYHFSKDKSGDINSFLFFQYNYGVSNWVKQ